MNQKFEGSFLNKLKGVITKFMILILVIAFAVQSASSGAIVDYNWNGTHLIVNVTSPQSVGSAQIKLNLSNELTIGSATLTGFISNATYIQLGTEHRWFQLSANGNNNGVLTVPVTCSYANGSYEVKLIGVNIKDNNKNSIPTNPKMPIYQMIECGGNFDQNSEANKLHKNNSLTVPIEVISNKSEKIIPSVQKELQTEKSLETNTIRQETENKIVNPTLLNESKNVTTTAPDESKGITSVIGDHSGQSNNSAQNDMKGELRTQENKNSNQWLWIISILSTLVILAIIIKKFYKD